MKRATLIATLTICFASGWFAVELDGQHLRRAELKRVDRTLRRVSTPHPSSDRGSIIAMGPPIKGRGPWVREQAVARVTTKLHVAKVDLWLHDHRLFAFEPARVPPDFLTDAGAFRLTPDALVDLVAARTRLDTVMDEIVGKENAAEHLSTSNTPLTASALNEQLQALGVGDADAVTASFDWGGLGEAHVIRLQKPTVLLRLWGGASSPIGRYFFCCDPRAHSSTRPGEWRWTDATDLALPPENRAEHLIAATLPAGTRIIVGVVAENFAKELGGPVRGGNTQIFVPEPVSGLHAEHLVLQSLLPNSEGPPTVPTEVAVWHDDRLLRFRPEQK